MGTGLAFAYIFFGSVLALIFQFIPNPSPQRTQLFIHLFFRLYIHLIQLFGLITLDIQGRKWLEESGGRMVIANHPSLLDVVILMSLIPNAKCVIKHQLWTHPLLGRLMKSADYIANDLEGEVFVATCKKTLDAGQCLIIFPEGTRTIPGAFPSFQRGFANLALFTQVVGGCDTLCGMTQNGFNSLEILSNKHCNPFSVNRDGINIGEGAAAFLLSRDEGPVQLLAIGETSDAHHLTAPDPTGNGASTAMLQALQDAKLNPADIGYINLHGTGTVLNDAMESAAVASLFGDKVLCSSTKGMTGYTLGAAGGIEAAFLWLTLNPVTNPDNLLPPQVWDGERDPQLPALHFVTSEKAMGPMLSNSFGFGGSNASLIFGRAT